MITTIDKNVLDILKSALFGIDMELESISDWNSVLSVAYEQSVFSIVYDKCNDVIEKQLSAADKQKWNKMAISYYVYSLNNQYQHSELHCLLKTHNIPYLILKGQSSAFYYPNPILRNSGDVDFLIYEKDIEKVKELLKSESFIMSEHNTSSYHKDFYRKGERLEMHWEPCGIPNGEKGELCRSYLNDAISSAVLYESHGLQYCIPDKFHHGLIILLHTAFHILNTGVGLRHLCDWATFVNSIDEEEFVVLYREKLTQIGLWRFAQILTQLSMHYLGCNYKSWADERIEQKWLEDMMSDIFAGGNFGKKDPERINEAKLISTDSTVTVTDDKMIIVLARRLVERTQNEYPFFTRARFLLPFGCLFVAIRHLLRVLNGSRPKINLGKMITGAKERKTIYKRLKLFQ